MKVGKIIKPAFKWGGGFILIAGVSAVVAMPASFIVSQAFFTESVAIIWYLRHFMARVFRMFRGKGSLMVSFLGMLILGLYLPEVLKQKLKSSR